jgi:dTMP kinase
VFVTFDGVDGGGKSTQIARLAERLEASGRSVERVRDPGSTAAGEAIRGLLLDSQLAMHRRSEALLYMAARAQLVEELIRPALAAGKVVLSDRFLLANVVYQSASGGVAPHTLWELGTIATGGLRPDLTLLFDLPAEVSLGRIARPADRMEARGAEYLEAVRQAFLREVPRASESYQIIDAAASVEAVAEQVWTTVETFCQSSGRGSLGPAS